MIYSLYENKGTSAGWMVLNLVSSYSSKPPYSPLIMIEHISLYIEYVNIYFVVRDTLLLFLSSLSKIKAIWDLCGEPRCLVLHLDV